MATEHKRKIQKEIKKLAKSSDDEVKKLTSSELFIENPQGAKTEELLRFLPLVLESLNLSTDNKKKSSSASKKRKRTKINKIKDAKKQKPETKPNKRKPEQELVNTTETKIVKVNESLEEEEKETRQPANTTESNEGLKLEEIEPNNNTPGYDMGRSTNDNFDAQLNDIKTAPFNLQPQTDQIFANIEFNNPIESFDYHRSFNFTQDEQGNTH